MILDSFEYVMREHMDYSDRETIKAIAESSDDQNKMLVALTSKLYDLIVAKADKIDFATIARSRGDITKIEKYEQLMECIDVIRNIVVSYKQDPRPVDIVSTAVQNLKDRTQMFKRAFVIGAPLATLTYNTIGLSIVSSISFLIATCIEYVKSPQAESFQMALDVVAYSKTEQNLLFENLDSFNIACKSGEFDDAIKVSLEKSMVKRESVEIEVKPDSPFLTDEQIENSDNVVIHDDDDQIQNESITLGTIGVSLAKIGIGYLATRGLLVIVKLLIPLIRSCVYFWFSSKQKVSDYFAVQAELLEMNAYQLQYTNTVDIQDKQRIFDKQMKVAQRWRNISNRFNVDYTTSKKAAERIANDEAKRYTIDQINYNPNSEDLAYSQSALF